jgi:hypothetical protein
MTPAAGCTSDDKQPSGPATSIAEMSFSGALQLAITDQEQMATSIKQPG